MLAVAAMRKGDRRPRRREARWCNACHVPGSGPHIASAGRGQSAHCRVLVSGRTWARDWGHRLACEAAWACAVDSRGLQGRRTRGASARTLEVLLHHRSRWAGRSGV